METQTPSGDLGKVLITKKASARGASRTNWYRKSFKFQGKGSKGEFRRKERAYNNVEITDGRLTGGEATQISMEELPEGDVVIVAMGPTGSGRSTFIYAATGVDTGIGHSLESCTNEVKMIKFSFPEVSNCSLVFVDMPGFDDSRSSGSEAQKMIQNWLQEASKKNIAISGLLYFHRISDNYMAGTPLKSLRIFDDLSKKHGFRNVVITTTMWDEVDEDLGAAREEELQSKYWEPILGHSMTRRFLHTRQSAFLVLEGFIDAANRDFSLLIQEELSGMREHITVGLDLSKGKVTQISMDELSEGDVVIVAMGPAESGKSTFIYTATGVDTDIGHNLESRTSEIKMVRFSSLEVINCSLVFVDMPPFDDKRSSGSDVQGMIRNWLQEAFKKNIAISGLLYFHRISDNHMVGTPLKNLLIFDRSTRDHGFQNVIVTTTMWDGIEQQVGAAREEELKSKYWEPILGHSTTRRFLNSRQSAFMVLEGFIDTATRDFSLLIRGLFSMREHNRNNTVGLDLLSKVESSIKEQDEVLKRLRIEMKTTMLLGGGILESLLVQYRTIRAELAVAVEELGKAVGVPIGKRLLSLIG